MEKGGVKVWNWRHDDATGNYLVSTDISLLDHDFINKAFATKEMHWAKPATPDQMSLMLSQSQTFGLYLSSPPSRNKSADSPSSPRTPSPTLEAEPDEYITQIGLARFITDHVTMAYLTDVYIMPEYQGKGLGKWLMTCCNEVLTSLPSMRRAMLLTSSTVSKNFYVRELGFHDAREEDGLFVMMKKGPGQRDAPSGGH